MSQYFDACLLAHATCYFRSYELPGTSVTGIAGVFEPSLPLSRHELLEAGLWDIRRLARVRNCAFCAPVCPRAKGAANAPNLPCQQLQLARLSHHETSLDHPAQPYIAEWTVRAAFGVDYARWAPLFFHVREQGMYEMKRAFDTESKIQAKLAGKVPDHVINALMGLLNNVCLLRRRMNGDPVAPYSSAGERDEDATARGGEQQAGAASTSDSDDDESGDFLALSAEPGSQAASAVARRTVVFHPRADMHATTSFIELDEYTRGLLRRVYASYFGAQQREAWLAEGRSRLTAMCAAAPLAVFADDLAAPHEVSNELGQLGIVGLRLHRLPQGAAAERGGSRSFVDPAELPYGVVASTSTQDTAPLRAWWEEDRALSAQFYNAALASREGGGEAASAPPASCTPELARAIVARVLASPAMWAILPMQDVLAMDGVLRHPDPHAERINIPASAHHVWRWRLHLTVEELAGGLPVGGLPSSAKSAGLGPGLPGLGGHTGLGAATASGSSHLSSPGLRREASREPAATAPASHPRAGSPAALAALDSTRQPGVASWTTPGPGPSLAAAVRAMLAAAGRDPTAL